MVLDRTQAPVFQTIESINIPAIVSLPMANANALYHIKAGQQAVVKIELNFAAGTFYEDKNGVSNITAKMLGEGTVNKSATQISEYFDRYGAFVEYIHGAERAGIVVFCLTKFLPEILPLVKEQLSESVFREEQLDKLKNIMLQTHRVNSEKTAYVAGQMFRDNLYPQNYPYGRTIDEQSIEVITREDLVAFYEQNIKQKACKIFVSGGVTEQDLAYIQTYLGQDSVSLSPEKEDIIIPENRAKRIVIEKEGALQSSIRMGKRLFTRHSADYHKFLVLNETFGGYFGSRLMKNIREDKGFTYGISSGLSILKRDGYMVIGTDVKRENTQQTLDEISKEIKRLQTELMPASELETVKNYMVGSFVGSMNTPFDIAERQKIVLNEGLPFDFYEQYITKIKTVTAQDVLEMANRYYQTEQMIEVVVGGI
jgi:zinc protease